MKKVVLAILFAALFCTAFTGMSETAKPVKALYLETGNDRQLDLVGSGIPQTIRLQYIGVENDATLQVVVFGSDGGVNLFNTEISVLDTGAIADLDSDGIYEILLSGRIHAMDYVTYCIRFSDEEGMKGIPFADIDRGSDKTGYTDTGYGLITAITESGIELSGYQDVLGTYVGTRTLTLINEKMELNDDGLWKFDVREEEMEYKSLKLQKAMNVIFSNGSRGTLKPGEVFTVTASDLKSVVYFKTTDGRTGHFEIEPDLEEGWGSLINGISEREYFEYIPYAG